MSKFYDIEPVWEKRCNYTIIMGGRNTGKSYAAKRKAIQRAWDNPDCNRFMLVRRTVEEIKPSVANQYFQDVDIISISGGKANAIEIYQKKIYAVFYDYSDDKVKKSRVKHIGYTAALNVESSMTSGSYLDVDLILFEEFASRKGYLPNEVGKLENLVSTVARMRFIRVIMIGNTITRVCPYYTVWKLSRIPTQEIGTIDIYERNSIDVETGAEITVRIAVDYCKSNVKSQMFFGETTDMITKGSWQVEPAPKLDFSIAYFKPQYRMVFFLMGFKFLASFYHVPEVGYFWLISPKTTRIKPHTRVITDFNQPSKYYTVGLVPLNRVEKALFSYFSDSFIYYQTDLCAADFKNAYRKVLLKH